MNYKNYIKGCILLFALSMSSVAAYAADDDDIIEFQGDRYVIHVDRMHPDSEMTLLDVLNTCPEFLSINGKKIDQNYKLRTDNIDLVVDAESFLAHVKACEIDHIQICSNTSVAKAVNGTKGVIDIYYRNDSKNDGKVALSGSTYGNGMLYADVANRSEKLTVQAYALARSSYGKAYPTDVYKMTDRGLAENVHLSLDWKISKNDRLFIKAYQEFDNNKQKIFAPDLVETHPYYNRYVGLVLSYSHTFRNDAILFAEIGADYTRETDDGSKMGDSYPYGFIEFNTPLFTPDLWLMIGAEMDHENTWHIGENREQYLKTDFYAQLDYTHGPWVLMLGDRFRMMNYWNRQYDSDDQSLWTHGRSNHSYLASVGYKAGRHFVQALFARRNFVPEMSDFLVDETAPTTALRYDADSYSTNLAHQAVLRYSYQQKHFFYHTSVESTWYSHLPGPNNMLLGCLIFIDDYFNCLTVGSVMRPVTDKHRISRAKLAYLIDSTAAPICIIAPISSWAAAVAGFVKGENGIHIFIQSIPFNFYAILTLVMMAFIIFMKMDYGPMLLHENNARQGDLLTSGKGKQPPAESPKEEHVGRVSDLVVPVVLLVTGCVIGMIYTGGFFQGKSFAEAFAASDASVGLVMGSSVALVTTIAYYLLRQSLSFADCMECLPEGFKQMVPAMLILTFAWTLKSMIDSLGAATYVASLVEHSAAGLMGFLPAIIFVVAVGLAFASGTSWGTFGILIPIVVSCLQEVDPQLMIISISACMAGAVCGDHCSPISDTTIMSSAGAQCDHINHVTTQLPYALTVASVSFFTFLLAGFIKNALLSLLFGIVALFLLLVFIRRRYSSRQSTVSCKHHK